ISCATERRSTFRHRAPRLMEALRSHGEVGMTILTTQQIDQGVNDVVKTQSSVITGLGDDAWTYFLKFTAYFEGAVNFMYSNKDLPKVSGPDVTVGVGISLPNRESVQGEFIRTSFFVKGTNFMQPATLAQVQGDYDTVAGM